MTQTPKWETVTCETCGKERQVKYRKYGVRVAKNCHSCAGKKLNPARWSTKHGHTGTKLYWMWCGMKNRCYTVKSPAYRFYGAKGIVICDDWLDFAVFRAWAMANGYDPTIKLDLHRRDSSKNYCPENCVWLPRKEHRRMAANATFSILDVAVIKRLLADGFRPFEIAKEYDVNPCLVSSLKLGNTWGWVESA
jgi:hypothetical protein